MSELNFFLRRYSPYLRICPALALILSLPVFVTACAGKRAPRLASEQAKFSYSPPATYTIQAGDELDIKFYYYPELNESVVVRPDGKISLQLVSETSAKGLTPEQLRETLVKKYISEIKKPKIAVLVRSFASQKVFIDGEVGSPGVVSMPGRLTVLQAVSSAGGFKDSAYLKRVLLVRRTADGRPQTMYLNLEDAIDGSEPERDIFLSPLDVVYVPRSGIADVNLWVDQYLRRNLPVPFAFTVNP